LIQEIAIDMCKSMLGNDNFDTQTSYWCHEERRIDM